MKFKILFLNLKIIQKSKTILLKFTDYLTPLIISLLNNCTVAN